MAYIQTRERRKSNLGFDHHFDESGADDTGGEAEMPYIQMDRYRESDGNSTLAWPSQDIRLPRGCCARIHHPCTPPAHLHRPPWCNTMARLLDSIRLPFPTSRLYATYNTILVITISCNSQTLASIMTSTNPEPMIPAGRAKKPMPTKAMIEATNLQIGTGSDMTISRFTLNPARDTRVNPNP